MVDFYGISCSFQHYFSYIMVVSARIHTSLEFLYSLSNNKILVESNLKDLADAKINATFKTNLIWGGVQNIVGKGENAGYQHFLLFPQCFQKAPLSGSIKVRIV